MIHAQLYGHLSLFLSNTTSLLPFALYSSTPDSKSFVHHLCLLFSVRLFPDHIASSYLSQILSPNHIGLPSILFHHSHPCTYLYTIDLTFRSLASLVRFSRWAVRRFLQQVNSLRLASHWLLSQLIGHEERGICARASALEVTFQSFRRLTLISGLA